MAVLVTGGAGFIGSHLVEKLLNEGREVVCLDDFNDYYDPALKRQNIADIAQKDAFALCEGDIRDEEFCEQIFSKHKVTEVVHLAARAGVRPSLEDPLLYQDVNVRGTLNLLELARRNEVRKFVFGSTSAVYGNSSAAPFTEDQPATEPISPYGASKRAAELFCHSYHQLYGLPTVCLRYFTVYGPRQRPDMAIHMFTRLIEQGKPITMFGDGTTKRDYTFYSDIIQGTVAALDADLDFEIINLGGSETTELREMIGLIENMLGKQAEIRRLPEQPGDVRMTCADVSKAQALLGYRPQVRLREGISLFVDWYRERVAATKA